MTGSTVIEHARTAVADSDGRRIVVIGPCAAGKSTLVAALKEHGYDARVSGQEHSEIRTLWTRSSPDVLVALSANITAIRARRGPWWPEWLLELEKARLTEAIDHLKCWEGWTILMFVGAT